ncbi:MAG: cob(I)yrinic acid a,c-diamide adenosyltransferase [bacterium]|nr:cob(I)yrinic acid a,c-diamide adenosyltransferase [bacterium]
MVLFTGKGDDGTTKLFDSGRASKDGARHDSAESGKRASKASPIFECLGMLDELNTLVGWCKAGCPDDLVAQERSVRIILHDVQDHLFTLQAEVAGAAKSIPLSSVEAMGVFIGRVESEMPPIKTFLVPGATELSARLDIARAVARRAERRLVTLHESGERRVSEPSRAYANRLSSLLYALTRLVNHRTGVVENPPAYRDV